MLNIVHGESTILGNGILSYSAEGAAIDRTRACILFAVNFNKRASALTAARLLSPPSERDGECLLSAATYRNSLTDE